jgi:hypothetical protein
MNAKALSLRNLNEPNPLVAALREAEHAVIVAEAICLGLTIIEVTGRPDQGDGEVLVGCEIGGTSDQLVGLFRRLADKQVFGWYSVEMGEDARGVRNADDWGSWFDDMVDEPLMKFTVELPRRKK